jgi:hypothetical protein
LITRASKFGNPTRWFYFLRLLRLALLVPGREEALRHDTAQHLDELLPLFFITSDAVVREMRLLLKSICSSDDLNRTRTKYPQFRTSSTFLNVEVPSYLIEILRKPAIATMPEVLAHIDQNRKELLQICFVDVAVIALLTRNRSLISHPEEYLACFLTTRFPFFEQVIPLIPIMVAQASWHLRALEGAVSALADHCLFLPSALPVLSIVYHALLNGSIEAELNEFEIVQGIFIADQNVENVRHFATELRTATPFVDVRTILQKFFLTRENRFVAMFVVIVVFLQDWTVHQRRKIVDLLIRRASSLPLLSRKACMIHFGNQRIDNAFLCALAETDDEAAIGEIFRGIT